MCAGVTGFRSAGWAINGGMPSRHERVPVPPGSWQQGPAGVPRRGGSPADRTTMKLRVPNGARKAQWLKRAFCQHNRHSDVLVVRHFLPVPGEDSSAGRTGGMGDWPCRFFLGPAVLGRGCLRVDRPMVGGVGCGSTLDFARSGARERPVVGPEGDGVAVAESVPVAHGQEGRSFSSRGT